MEPKWCESIGFWTQVVTLSFDLTHDLTVHGKYIGQEMARCETVTFSNLLAHEWAVHSLI